MYNVDVEIETANSAIEEELDEINENNRGKVARRILKSTRDLNDNIAYKIFKDLYPLENADLKNVAKKFCNIKGYQFISKFNNYLQKVVSHFTPSDDGAERLFLKYYEYLLKLKKVMYARFNVEILKNLDKFILDIDKDTNEFREKAALKIEQIKGNFVSNDYDNYYIYKNKPFIYNKKIYYEVSFELANDNQNKFNRITAFTDLEIDSQYAVSLAFCSTKINVLDEEIPILIITDWKISIRPCEFQNLAKIFELNIKIERSQKDYNLLMSCLKDYQIDLLDIVLSPIEEFNMFKEMIEKQISSGNSNIFRILSLCRIVIKNNELGKESIRYLLYKMNNKIIKQFYTKSEGLNNYKIHKKCYPFECKPFSYNPVGHITNLYDLLNCIEVEGHESELLARKIKNNTEQNGVLYTDISELTDFGSKEQIEEMISIYNESLYYGHRPDAELAIHNEYVYQVKYENSIKKIIDSIKEISTERNEYIDLFEKQKIEALKYLENDKLDSNDKEEILNKMRNDSKVNIIYGAAGTGKTTLTNLISHLFVGKNRLYIANTHAAVNNLRSRIKNQDNKCIFQTVKSFLSNGYFNNYDLIVVDECSTITNEDILNVLEYRNSAMLILTGDIYQIESIGYGSWFKLIRYAIEKECVHELVIPHRADQENLKELWNEVRTMNNDNQTLEKIVKNRFTQKLDKKLFERKSSDEIILCLNYNGLYGLNNINRFKQINNKSKAVNIGVLQFKEDDDILFNDSNRFEVFQNNLKGKILKINEFDYYIEFTVEVFNVYSQEEIEAYKGLLYISGDDNSTIVKFNVNKYPPYYHDQERENKDYVIPFQVAYAVSIHKSQGLEYESVKVVITDENEEQITHNVFYTAITRTKKYLTIYWSPEVCDRVLKRIKPNNNLKDYNILKSKYDL